MSPIPIVLAPQPQPEPVDELAVLRAENERLRAEVAELRRTITAIEALLK